MLDQSLTNTTFDEGYRDSLQDLPILELCKQVFRGDKKESIQLLNITYGGNHMSKINKTQDDEILSFNNILNDYVKKEGIDVVSKTLYRKVWNIKNNDSLDNNKLTKLKYIIENIHLYNISNKHDILCFILKSLELLPLDKIPKKNFESHNAIREYDPSKNGQNILKHGVSFNDVVDNYDTFFGELVVPTRSKVEDRFIYFSRIKEENKERFILSICYIPNDIEQAIDNDFYQKIGEVADKVLRKNTNLSINQREITPELLLHIINSIPEEGLEKILNSKTPALRIISAREYTEDNYVEIIKQAIQDENLDDEVLEILKKIAIENIKRINKFTKEN